MEANGGRSINIDYDVKDALRKHIGQSTSQPGLCPAQLMATDSFLKHMKPNRPRRNSREELRIKQSSAACHVREIVQ